MLPTAGFAAIVGRTPSSAAGPLAGLVWFRKNALITGELCWPAAPEMPKLQVRHARPALQNDFFTASYAYGRGSA